MKSGSTPPYVAVLTPGDFTKTIAEELIKGHDAGRVNGVVVLGGDEATKDVAGFSADAKCPNRKFGLYAEESDCHEWNAPGSGLLLKDFPFPVFLVA